MLQAQQNPQQTHQVECISNIRPAALAGLGFEPVRTLIVAPLSPMRLTWKLAQNPLWRGLLPHLGKAYPLGCLLQQIGITIIFNFQR